MSAAEGSAEPAVDSAHLEGVSDGSTEQDTAAVISSLKAEVLQLTKDKADMEQSFGRQRAALKDLFIKLEQEKDAERQRSEQLQEECDKLRAELSSLNEAAKLEQSQHTSEQEKLAQQIANLQHILDEMLNASHETPLNTDSYERLRLMRELESLRQQVQHEQERTKDRTHTTFLDTIGKQIRRLTTEAVSQVSPASTIGRSDAACSSSVVSEDSSCSTGTLTADQSVATNDFQAEIEALNQQLAFANKRIRELNLSHVENSPNFCANCLRAWTPSPYGRAETSSSGANSEDEMAVPSPMVQRTVVKTPPNPDSNSDGPSRSQSQPQLCLKDDLKVEVEPTSEPAPELEPAPQSVPVLPACDDLPVTFEGMRKQAVVFQDQLRQALSDLQFLEQSYHSLEATVQLQLADQRNFSCSYLEIDGLLKVLCEKRNDYSEESNQFDRCIDQLRKVFVQLKLQIDRDPAERVSADSIDQQRKQLETGDQTAEPTDPTEGATGN